MPASAAPKHRGPMNTLVENAISPQPISARPCVAPRRPDALIFLHVPKTAGTTLWLILRRQYSPAAVVRCDADDFAPLHALTPPERDQTRVFLGHFPFGLHQQLDRPATYVTVLRDPVERTLSRYAHVLRDGPDDACRPGDACRPDDAARPGLSLEAYLTQGLGEKDNWQTRLLAGPEAMALPEGQCDRDVLEQAQRHLAERFVVAGLTERFEETVLLLQRTFGWRLPCYARENVGPRRLRQAQVPGEVMALIRE